MGSGLHSRFGPVRKAAATLLRFERMVRRRATVTREDLAPPAVIADSFPKSGTHLLEQIVEVFPAVRNFGVFLSSMTSSWAFRERTTASTLRVINSSIPGELLRAHLFYDPAYEAAIREKGMAHYFIYRDPRDVVVSEAHYLREMNRWHRLHRVMKKLDPEAAITMSIEGVDPSTGLEYPDIGKRFARCAGWIGSTDTFAVRFEDLRSESCKAVVASMVDFYQSRHVGQVAKDPIVQEALANIRPESSHTFRAGRPSAWRREFTTEHKARFKRVAGQLLVDLGYETDLHW